MSRFPNLTEQEKDKLITLFLTSGTIQYNGDHWCFHIQPNELLIEFNRETEDLFTRAMKDLYSPDRRYIIHEEAI